MESMLQRPTAGHIIILFNAARFVWQPEPDPDGAGSRRCSRELLSEEQDR